MWPRCDENLECAGRLTRSPLSHVHNQIKSSDLFMTCIKPSKVCLIIEQAGPTAHCYELKWPLIIDSEQLGTLMTRRSDQEVLNFILKIWVSQKLFDKKKQFPCCTKWHPPFCWVSALPVWHTHTDTHTHDLLIDKATKLHQQSTTCATDSGFSDMYTEWRWS